MQILQPGSPYAAFQAYPEQLLRFDRKLHRQFAKYFLAEAIDDHGNRSLSRNSALLAIKKLIFSNFGG